MKTKHTPGPWRYRQPLADAVRGQAVRSLEVLTEGPNGMYKPYIADVRSLDANGADNTEANARLIAAAPDLLAALEDLRGELRLHVKLDVRKHYSLMVADVAADKAIAKARGQ